ncbi:MAG: DUF2207 family protein [Actinomycetota bacterium]
MAKKHVRAGIVGWLIFLVVIGSILASIGVPIWAAISEKSYEFPRVRIDATVQPDGSLDLVERRTYDFDGDFREAFFTVAWPVTQIEDFTVEENGRPVRVRVEGRFATETSATWGLPGEDDVRTFTISYRARCAVDVWADTAHLLWMFIGRGWDVETEDASIRVHLPGFATNAGRLVRPQEDCPAQPPAGEVRSRPLAEGETRAWGHGPLGGEVRIPDPDTVTLDISNLAPFAFVEGSILFPKEAVPLAHQVPVPMRQSILDQEAEMARVSNALRLELLAEEEAERRRRTFFWILLAAEVLVFVVAMMASRLRDRVPGIPDMLQDPPEELHPVDLAQLWGAAQGKLSMQHEYRAQMLHLARIGAIELQPVGRVTDPEDFIVKLKEVRDANPRDMEFLEFLFPGSKDDEVTFSSLKPTGKRRKELKQWWDAVDTRRKSTLKRLVPSVRWEALAVTLVGLAGLVGAFIAPALVGPWGLLLAPVSIVGMTVAHILIRPRLRLEFRERVARWRAFRRFLTEFSTLPEAPTLAVIIWERYLVDAVALGCADEVEKQVRALIPPQELPEPWRGAPSGIGALGYVHSVNTVSVHTAASVTASSSSSGIGSFSSSGGGGGGFSSGGGGGGGGTGGGAR